MINIYKVYYGEHIYVGATTKSIKERFKQHKYYATYEGHTKRSKALYNGALYSTMRDKGIGKFKVELLATTKDINEARKLESYYIESIGTLNRVSSSGFTTKSNKPVESVRALKTRIKELEKEVEYWKQLNAMC